MKNLTGKIICPDCLGDGIETCHNPDHGFLSGVLGAVYGANESACPCCGHDPNHKMKGQCYTCSGTGVVSENEYYAYVNLNIPADEDLDSLKEICFKNVSDENR